MMANALRASPPLAAVPALTVSGAFPRSPFHGQLCAAELSMLPLHKPSEYRHAEDFEQASRAPVLLSPGQRYRFLAELVEGLKAAVPTLRLALVRLGAPDFRTQLPRRLLLPDVMLSHDPWLLLPAVDFGGDPVAVVWQDLRADSVEPGGNGLAVTLLDGGEGGDAFVRFMETAPLLAGLAGQRLVRSALP